MWLWITTYVRATLCMAECPEVFEVRDDDFLYVLQEEPSEELRQKLVVAQRVVRRVLFRSKGNKRSARTIGAVPACQFLG